MKKMKRCLSLVVTAAMFMGLMVTSTPTISQAAVIRYDIGVAPVTIQEAGEYLIEGITTSNKVIVDAAGKIVNITLKKTSIYTASCAFKIVAGTVNLTLEDSNYLASGTGAGLENGANVLNISANGNGILTAIGGANSAGIGGADKAVGSMITINNGSIYANGGINGAGIGGGSSAAGGNIIINGGTVIASGGAGAAGIGSGTGALAGSVLVNGGSIKATAGIGAIAGSGLPTILPKNSKGLDLMLEQKLSLTDVEKGMLTQKDQSGTPYYNMKDAQTIDGKYWMYLPRYAIAYNNLNGAINTNPVEYNLLSNITLTGLIKANDTFYGWYTEPAAGNRVTTIPAGSTGNKVLYARWTVIGNNAPMLYPIAPVTCEAGKLLSLMVSGTDPDGNQLTYSASDLPAGASFNADTRIFTWTPAVSQLGSYAVKFTVSDGQLADTKAVVITVTNSPIVINPTATQLINDTINYMNRLLGDKKANSYTAKLRNVLAKLNKGDKVAATNQLKAFMNEVYAQSGKKISKRDAAVIIDKAKAALKAIDPNSVFTVNKGKQKIDKDNDNDDDDDDDRDNGNKGKGKGKGKNN